MLALIIVEKTFVQPARFTYSGWALDMMRILRCLETARKPMVARYVLKMLEPRTSCEENTDISSDLEAD